jgi:dihydrofolate synthase/folylpolyglutamate synthase
VSSYEPSQFDAQSSVPTPVDIAELALVEAELDKRWPETKIEPSLTRIEALMDVLGSPQHNYPSVHVTGTNGKTSVTRMIDSLMSALHRRTGRTTSPHLQIATERISIDGHPISPRLYVDTFREIEPYVQMIDAQSQEAGGPAMSKFEVLTAMAYAAFAEAPVDVAVVEVGLGGRWDATNVIDGQVAVITPISLDHAEYLGTDLAGIAEEKAGIIKKGREDLVPVDTVAIIAEQTPEVMEVLLRRAVEVEAAVAREGSEFKVLARQIAVGGQQLELQGLSGVYTDIFLPLHGEHQARNAALALAAVEAFFGAGPDRQLDQDAIRNGFASIVNPGRLERVRSAPTVFLDAAHNPDGARALAAALAAEFDFRKLVGVVSVMADKDVDAILTAFESVFDEIVVTHNRVTQGDGCRGAGEHCRREVRRRARRRGAGACRRAGSRDRNRRAGRRTRRSRIRGRCGGDGIRRDRRRRPHAVRKGPRVSTPSDANPESGGHEPGGPESGDTAGEFGPPTKDPWKSFRGVMAGTLILEAIVVLLALPVVAVVGGGLTAASAGFIIGLAVLMILGAGVQGKPWAMGFNVALQVILLFGFFVHPSIAGVAITFGIVWGYLVYLQRDIKRRMDKGLLPGQRD